MKIFDLNIFGIHIAPSYYGLAYVIGFILGYIIIYRRKIFTEKELDILGIFIFFGVFLGGRIGYILFYNLNYYITNPIDIFKTWQGGMSFHGGIIGVVIAMILFAIKYKKNFYNLADNIASVLPIGIFLGRIANYLNKELLGKTYTGFLAVEKNGQFYFPSPLLEAICEGLILYFILFYIFKKRKYYGQIGGGFLLFYGIFRFIIEFIRIPDPQVGYIFGFFTMGQILTLPMMIFGFYYLVFFKKYPKNLRS